MILLFKALPIFPNGNYTNPSLYLKGATIKNDHLGPTDKEMRLSLSVPSAEDTLLPSVQPHRWHARIGSDSAIYRKQKSPTIP
jgi:hypothetical protein